MSTRRPRRIAGSLSAALDRLYPELLRSGGKNGRPLAAKTVRNVHLVLHRALASAVKKRRLPFNPADGVEAVPRAEKRQSRERRMRERIWSPTEVRAFLASVREERDYAAWLLLATCGLRRGELLGLAWPSVSLDEGTIRVEQALVLLGGAPTITPVKSNDSAAKIAIDSATVASLREHRARQAAERLAAGPAYDATSDLVFVDELGAPVHPDGFLRRFQSLAKKAGLRPISVHGVRHTYASAMLAAGLPMKVISDRLRHAGIGITADLYTHLSPELDRAAAESGATFILGT